MITHYTTYHKNTYQLRIFKEYHDRVLVKAELYNDKGRLIFLKHEDGNQRFYWNDDNTIREIRYHDGVRKIYIYDKDNVARSKFYYKFPDGRNSTICDQDTDNKA